MTVKGSAVHHTHNHAPALTLSLSHTHTHTHSQVRQIDCVTVKGSAVPLRLFTYDINLDTIAEGDPTQPGMAVDR